MPIDVIDTSLRMHLVSCVAQQVRTVLSCSYAIPPCKVAKRCDEGGVVPCCGVYGTQCWARVVAHRPGGWEDERGSKFGDGALEGLDCENKVTRAGQALCIAGSVEFLLNLAKNMNEARGQEQMNGVEANGQGNNNVIKHGRTVSYWHPPDYASFKVNVDASFNLTTGEAAVEIIARDHEGQPYIMAWKFVGCGGI
jgi:hypothetical protein